MRIGSGASAPFDLFQLYQDVSAGAAPPPELLDQLLRGPAGAGLFTGDPLTGAEAVPSLLGQGGGLPLHQTHLAHHLLDPRAKAHLAEKADATAKTRALAQGPVDREKLEAAIKELFQQLAQQGLPLEARPGSALAEAMATGDFSQLEDAELMQLLVLMALYGRNRHKPGAVAGQANAAMAPRGSWPAGGGANRAGGGTQPTGANRNAAPPTGPVPPAGDIPPGTPAGQRLAMSARQVANSMNSTGWCYRGVKQAVSRATGVQLTGGSAYQAADQLAASGRFREIGVAPNQLRDLPPGAVVVWGQTDRSPHGHISVALGDGQEASDHIQAQITSLRGASNYRVFMPNE